MCIFKSNARKYLQENSRYRKVLAFSNMNLHGFFYVNKILYSSNFQNWSTRSPNIWSNVKWKYVFASKACLALVWGTLNVLESWIIAWTIFIYKETIKFCEIEHEITIRKFEKVWPTITCVILNPVGSCTTQVVKGVSQWVLSGKYDALFIMANKIIHLSSSTSVKNSFDWSTPARTNIPSQLNTYALFQTLWKVSNASCSYSHALHDPIIKCLTNLFLK